MRLNWCACSSLLRSILYRLKGLPEMESFRLVGGTGLALQLGHRVSNDIDLFTDNEPDTVDLKKIDTILRENFNYVDQGTTDNFKIGIMRFIGDSPDNSVKIDLFFTESFIRPALVYEGINIASIEDIAVMKLEMISRGGRKKDFWDLMEITDHYDLARLLEIYLEKYPYMDTADVLKGLTDFNLADEQDDPICLRGRIWELIKLDIDEIVSNYR